MSLFPQALVNLQLVPLHVNKTGKFNIDYDI
jgi:hypothetical protein